MTLKKLMEILETLAVNGINGQGSHFWAAGTGELHLSLNTQPSRTLHEWLLKKRFVLVDGDYIYRPVYTKKWRAR